MEKLGYLIPGGLVLAAVAGLLGWDLYRTIRNTPPKRKK